MARIWILPLLALPLCLAAACGTDSDATGAGGGGAGAGAGGAGGSAPTEEYAVVVRGPLFTDDLVAAKARHEEIVGGSREAAQAAGDLAHDVLLGTTMLDSTENEFLAIDRWNDPVAMQAFYADPDVQAAFATLFAAPPTIEIFVRQPSWENWGELESGDAHDPYFFHLALGTLAAQDPEVAHAAHDQVAAGGKEPSIAAGNVAHVVFTGMADPRRFLGVDIWSSDAPIVAFYSDPQFAAAFGPLFESVSQPVYRSTDWSQW